MRTGFFNPFYPLAALVALLCVVVRPVSAQPKVNVMDSYPPVGDFWAKSDDSFVYMPTVVSEHEEAMQKLWAAWHNRVEEVVYMRFKTSAQIFFKTSPSLDCQVSYMVARDGLIGNVRISKPSNNAIFNTMVLGVIKSVAHNPVLEFPPNSERQFVEKTATFTWEPSKSGFLLIAPPNPGPPRLTK
jgi:TonB C terminal